MIIHNCEQGTHEWLRLRAGIPTASNFARILSPKTARASDQAETYMNQLLAEWMVGHPITGPETDYMSRGSEYEPEAIKYYELTKDVETTKVGFITTDDGMIGCSPDRLVGPAGLAEFKCVKESTHIGYMLHGKLDEKYRTQVQGQLLVAERDTNDLVSYHPEMDAVIVASGRDEEYIGKLRDALGKFIERMLSMRDELTRRFGPFKHELKQPEGESFLNITPEDVDWITANATYTGEVTAPSDPVPVSDPVNPAVREAIKAISRSRA